MAEKLIRLPQLQTFKQQADLKYQDKLTAGANITITGSTVSATDTTYTAGTNITITGTTISATDTTYSDATTATAGLMSTADKVKLDGLISYSAGTGIAISTAGVISVSYPNADNESF